MLDLSTIQTFTSEHDPDVKYTIRPLTAITRARAESKTITARRDVLDLEIQAYSLGRQLHALIDASPKGESGKPLVSEDESLATEEMLEVNRRRYLAIENYKLLTMTQLAPEYMREGLVSLEGVTCCGKPVTVEQFIQAAPIKLYDEAYQLVLNGAYIDPEKAKNSGQSTTSGAAVDSEVKASIAPSAKPEPDTSTETVSDTFQNA